MAQLRIRGKIEWRTFGDAGVESLHLGPGTQPTLVRLRAWLWDRAPSGPVAVTALIEGCAPKCATGPWTCDTQLYWGGNVRGMISVEVLTVGGKDVLALLRAAAGRECRLTLEA